MIAFWIVAGVLLFLAFLLSVPIHLLVSAQGEIRVWMRVLFVKIPLFPEQKHRRSTKRKRKKNKNKSRSVKRKSSEKKDPSSVEKKKHDILSMLRLILKIAKELIRKTAKHLRVRICNYEICVSTEDAAQTALLYGAVTGLSSTLFGLLENKVNFKVKRGARVAVCTDFVGGKTTAHVKIDFWINLWGILSLLLAGALAFVKNKDPEKEQLDEDKETEEQNDASETNKK